MERLLTEDEIRERVTELGRWITDDFRGRPLTVVGILTGSLVFVADLVRRIDIPLRIGFLQASSYRGEATLPGELLISDDLLPDLANRDVLLVDDIFDTGRTLEAVTQLLRQRGPRSVTTAVLMRKPDRCQVKFEPDYCGFDVPDAFVVGYGVDFAEDYRQLPFIAAVARPDTLG